MEGLVAIFVNDITLTDLLISAELKRDAGRLAESLLKS
jgi:hypothetical protein